MPEQLAELEGRYGAIGGVSPLAEPHRGQVDAVARRARRRARRAATSCRFGAKHTDPLIEEAAAGLAAAGLERVIGLVLTPHGSSMGSQEYLDRAAAALGRDALRAGGTVVRRAGARRRCSPPACGTRWRAVDGPDRR